MYIKTEEKQKYIEENVKAIRKLLEKHFELYIQKEIVEENKSYDKKSDIETLDKKNKTKKDVNLYNHIRKDDCKFGNNINYINVDVEKQIFLDLPAIRINKKFNFKQYSRVYINNFSVKNGKITITGVLRKKYIYTAMIRRLPLRRYGLIKDIPFECKLYDKDINENDIYDIIPNIKITTECCKLGCFSKNNYGDEMANCCIEKDKLRIGIIKLN